MKAPFGYSRVVEKGVWNSPDTLINAQDTTHTTGFESALPSATKVSWADANRFGPGYLNGWAFGPKRNP